jgi:hypothetical protein
VAYRMTGSYVASCNCAYLCPCPVDGPPTGPNGQCDGVAVFAIREGNLDDTDLSNVAFALWNHFPSNITSGNWTVGIVVDEGASDDQAQAIERIVSGQEGGPFADFAPLIGDYQGMERARVAVTDGGLTVGDGTQIQFEPFTGGDGSPVTVRGAMFAFAPEYRVGKGSGQVGGIGVDFEPRYGEGAEFEYSSEMGDVHLRA